MIAKRRSRTQKKEQGAAPNQKGGKADQGYQYHVGGSRFAALEEEEDLHMDSEPREATERIPNPVQHHSASKSKNTNRTSKHGVPARTEKGTTAPMAARSTIHISNRSEGMAGKKKESQSGRTHQGADTTRTTPASSEPSPMLHRQDGGTDHNRVAVTPTNNGVKDRPSDFNPSEGPTKPTDTRDITKMNSSGMQIDGTSPPSS
ncbi:unnamed protein product [Linum trigynum]|uniref:Uncharacterized protein n=1 Tax=Linum trigynum TaxID=586398 RepID=A0AAV2CF14_9ROSI